MQSVVRVHDLVKRHASLGPPSLLRTPFEKLLERGAHLFLRAEFDKIRTLRVEPGKKDSRFAYIWSRTKSVKQAFSGPSLTLAIQHVEPQTRSKYWSDTSISASWPSVGAVLIPKTPHVCVLILAGYIAAIGAHRLPGVMCGPGGSLLTRVESKRKRTRFFAGKAR